MSMGDLIYVCRAFNECKNDYGALQSTTTNQVLNTDRRY